MTFEDIAALQAVAGVSKTSNIHIAVMSEPFLSYVFDSTKTIESRFSHHKIAPYGKVAAGDVVLMKAGPVVGSFKVAWAEYYDLTETPIEEIKQKYAPQLAAPDEFWQQRSQKRYATFMGITDVRRCEPMYITKRDRRAWVSLI